MQHPRFRERLFVLQPLSEIQMQPSPAPGQLAVIEHLAIESMDKLIALGKGSRGKLLRVRQTHDLMATRESFTYIFKLFRIHICCRCSDGRREGGPDDTRCLQCPQLLLLQPVDLSFDHLPETIGRLYIDLVERKTHLPATVFLRNKLPLSHVLQRGYHEQRIALGVPEEQRGKAPGKAGLRRLCREEFSYVGFPQRLQSNLVTQPAKQQILLQPLQRMIGKQHVYRPIGAKQ